MTYLLFQNFRAFGEMIFFSLRVRQVEPVAQLDGLHQEDEKYTDHHSPTTTWQVRDDNGGFLCSREHLLV